MNLIEGVSLSNLCDYSFGDQSGQWGNIYTSFMKEANLLNLEFVSKVFEIEKERNYMTLFIDNIRLYKRNMKNVKPQDLDYVNSLMNTNDLLDVGNMNVSTINNLSPVGGIYSGISDGATISSSTFSDLLPISSVGGLSVGANEFKVGSAFHLVCSGIFPSESKNDDIEIELCAIQGASTIQLGLVRLELENFDTAPSNFELEADFIIQNIGTSAQVAVSFDFTFNKQITKDFKGTRATNLATIDTTQASTLGLNARIIGTGGSSIKSTLAYLRKQY